jgi:hypothetical protein
MATNNQVKYEIAISRTGDGASQAVKDLNGVQAAVAKANGSVVANTTAVTQNASANALANKQFSVFKGTLTMVAGQAFPQLTASVLVAKNAIDAMRASNTKLKVDLVTTTGAVAGLAGLVLSAAAAWGVYAAEKQQANSAKDLSVQETEIQKRLVAEIDLLEQREELTRAEARRLRGSTGNSSGNRNVSDFLRYRDEGSARERIEELRLMQQLEAAEARASNPRGSRLDTRSQIESARAANLQENIEWITLYNQLQEEGLMTAQEADRAKVQADIAMYNRNAELLAQLTELQQLGQQVTQQFASGFSQAFVEAVSGSKNAKEAFSDFARSFLSQVAQMIMQQVVLNTLRNSSIGGLLGMAHGGMAGAMPQFAASGLAGVSSVSQATYFPKFNVVAGEAGREMLTVLARPRMMEVGGMQAVVGSAQGRQLAITDASSLAGGNGTNGEVNIRVTLGPELRAEIVQQSVKGAVVQVSQDMRQDTPISRGVKGLTG